MDKRREGSFDMLQPLFATALAALDPSSREDALQLLRAELTPANAPSTDADTRSLSRALFSDRWYAIHDSELQLLQGAGGAAAAAILALGKPITAAGALVILLYKYRRHRVELTGEQGLVLRELRRAGPHGLRFEQLRYKADVAHLGGPEIEAILKTLLSVPKTNGQITNLVTLHNDIWRAADV